MILYNLCIRIYIYSYIIYMTCNTYLNWRRSNMSLHSAVFFQANLGLRTSSARPSRTSEPTKVSHTIHGTGILITYVYFFFGMVNVGRYIFWKDSCNMVSNSILIRFLPNELQMICSWSHGKLPTPTSQHLTLGDDIAMHHLAVKGLHSIWP